MVRRICVLGLAILAIGSVVGHALNLFETAAPVGALQVAITFGFGLATTELSSAGTWYLVPQGRLTIGLLEGLDLGIHSGWSSEFETGDADWLGVLVDVKVTSAHVPDLYTVAWGAGGGFGLDFLGDGWGIFLQILFESHAPFFPVFLTYRSILPFDGGEIQFEGYIAAGLRLRLAPIARLLLVVDIYDGLPSLGAGLEIAF